MPDLELLDGLVATYRTLNLSVRPLPEDRLRRSSAAAGQSVRELVQAMRNNELRYSQALKARLTTGQSFGEVDPAAVTVIGTESEDDTTAALIAQFGTARESTLAMLRGLPESEWDATAAGPPTIRESVRDHVAADRAQLKQISTMIG